MFDLEATFEAGKVVPCKFTGKGVWQTPADAAPLAPAYPSAIPPTFKGATLTINSASYFIPRVIWKMNNDVVLREEDDRRLRERVLFPDDPLRHCGRIQTGDWVAGALPPAAE
jgi:hypothetical protein